MENNKNGTTPAQAATLPNGQAVVTTPSVVTPAPNGDKGNLSDGKVTIDLKEYRDLQRAKARTLSFEKRAALPGRQAPQTMKNPDGSDADPEIIERLNQSEARVKDAERKAMRFEVQNKVRDLLDKPEYVKLPASTKALILKNPAMLSEAVTLDEAMLDIEDFVNEQVSVLDLNLGTPGGKPNTPAGHDTPPTGAGGPAPVRGTEPEDLSKLRGPARSQAAIRNAMKSARGK